MKKKQFFAGLAAAALAAGVMAMPVGATGYSVSGGANQATIKKYLVVDKDVQTSPAVVFTYTLSPADDNDIPATVTTDTLKVYKGTLPTTATATATFTQGTTFTSGTSGDGITDSADKKYVSAEAKFDFSGVTFTEPGVYRYRVSETVPDGYTLKSINNERTLDVYVIDTNGVLSVSNAILYDQVITTAPYASEADMPNYTYVDPQANEKVVDNLTDNGSKSEGYINEYDSYDLTLEKTVTGNQGSKDKYFKFTVPSPSEAQKR